jgi:Fur family transcriptional regulator, stress-responsive regulator
VAVPTDPVDLLRQRGIQVTAQRLAVLRAVSREPHIMADAVAEAVRTEIGAISLQSVYDALGVLVTEGLIRRIQPAGSPARFEDRVGDNHHHLICRACGRVVDVDCAVGRAPCLTAHDDNGYQIDEAEVAYWGRCPECQGTSKATSSSRRRVRLTASAKATVVKQADTTSGAKAGKRSHAKRPARSHQRTTKRISRTK